MKIVNCNILSHEILQVADAICFTSNGVLKKNGALVMGAGVAKAFRDYFPGIDILAGQLVKENGNVCQEIELHKYHSGHMMTIVSFPTKYHWKDQSNIKLIEKSAQELVSLSDENNWKTIYLPRPGCKNGGLSWENEVKLVLLEKLDDRFFICGL